MQKCFLISLLLICMGCEGPGQASLGNSPLYADASRIKFPHKIAEPVQDTTKPAKPYRAITFAKKELVKAAPGTKSVLFNKQGSRLYAMNLEGMSIYEFDQPTRKVIREFKFKPTPGTGWDYATDQPIASYEEKPVEACLSHDDKIVWVSLHNAEGIVPIRVDSIGANQPPLPVPAVTNDSAQVVKRITVLYPGTNKKDSFNVPLIKTGKTPKVISRTMDNKYLLVSNWHSYNVSVLEMNKDIYPFGKVINTIPVAAIPRGIVIDDKNKRSYVAIMGGASLAVINNTAWTKEPDMAVESNPRHLVMDTSGHLFVSYNKLAKVACLDMATGATLFTTTTHAQPRTIILSKNYHFLFVTCYSSDYVDVFRITDSSFLKVASLPCKGHPVGVDIFENNETLEAWVCSYSNGSINVFSFTKSD